MTRLGGVKLKFAPHPKVASYPRGRTSNERLLNLVRRATCIERVLESLRTAADHRLVVRIIALTHSARRSARQSHNPLQSNIPTTLSPASTFNAALPPTSAFQGVADRHHQYHLYLASLPLRDYGLKRSIYPRRSSFSVEHDPPCRQL